MRWLLVCIVAVLAPIQAQAQDRDFCANRPGLGTPPCTLAPGQAVVEAGLLGWDHSSDAGSFSDDLTFGNLLLRVGLDGRTEVEVGFGGYGVNRLKDRTSGQISRQSGGGDVTLSLRRGLAGANGPVALQFYAGLPVGNKSIGSGDWSAGLLIPAALPLPHGFELDLTPELDLSPDGNRPGHHLVWGGVVGLGHGIGRGLQLEGEIGAWRDEDPDGSSSDIRAGLSLAWQARPNWQIDLEADQGLTAVAPRHSLALGMAHRF